MKGAVRYGARHVGLEERDEPRIVKPTDAIIRTSATCICGSDLWPYRGIVEEIGSAVTKVTPGQFVIGSFIASDNTCPHWTWMRGHATAE